MNRRFPGLVRRIGMAVAIGVAATVAVSWLAMFLPRGNAWHGPRTGRELGVYEAPDGKLWSIRRGENAWHGVVYYWWVQISGRGIMIPAADYKARAFDFRRLPRRLRPGSLDDLNMSAWYHETGWPLRALACSVHWKTQVANSDIIYTVRGGVQLPRDKNFNPRALPLTPVWPGFAANTFAFSCLWLLGASGAGAARRRVRVRRGRCPGCGYSRAGLAEEAACPECGRPAAPPSCQ